MSTPPPPTSAADAPSDLAQELPPFSGELDSVMSLEQFIIDQQERFPHSTGAFSRLIRDISVAAKIINRNIRRAGLVDVFGETGDINVQGETQKKLDAIADHEIIRALKRGGECCLIGSEEQEEPTIMTPRDDAQEKYAVFFDPLDGSSNTDVNVSVGTIFSVFNIEGDCGDAPEEMLEAALQPGSKQVAAGYVAYGSSTIFVYTTGDGVNGFTLDPSIGEFLLSHPKIQVPDTPKLYSINEADVEDFDAGVKRYLAWLKTEKPDGAGGPKRMRARYIGSFVSDFHRNLLTGGVYIYPASQMHPEGKLRLMYEANPMAFLVEQAGGKASTGTQRILDVVPSDLHQRTPVFIGNADLVDAALAFLRGEADDLPPSPWG
jgi:fructose-1,6-bisphosphatase I